MNKLIQAPLAFLKGILSILILVVNTLIFSLLTYVIVLLKVIVPNAHFKSQCTRWLEFYSECWIKLNLYLFSFLQETQWEISGLEAIDLKKGYFLISNHQSFVDVFVLQKVFTGKAPPFKYFMKQSLIWMPLVGIVWWALDCIFMKRYPKAVLEKNPHLREVDMKTTQKKCRLFKGRTITLVNFVEGTRFTKKKHDHQQSPYQKLLKPKAGGLAYMLAAMEGQIQDLINVTIIYPGKDESFWDFLCGKTKKIRVYVEVLPIPPDLLIGNYSEDSHYRAHIQKWLSQLWHAKDHLLVSITKEHR